MHRLKALTLVSVVSIPLLVACGNGDQESSKPAETVTVTATPSEDASEAVPPSSAETSEVPAIPEPGASDFQAVAIYTVQTETESFGGSSDELVKRLLELTCTGLLAVDGEQVGEDGFEFAEVALESSGVQKSEYPIVMRAATAFCPKALPEVAERYGS